MKDIRHYTEQNRRAWNEIAEVRGRRWSEKLPDDLYRSGRHTLSDAVVAAAGDVRGKSVLHLQCATGEDTLSWAVLGARVVGVDGADRQIEVARRRATELGFDVRFVAADVYALPADLGRFDVVFTGGGALVWLPDIQRWARAVADALEAGALLIVEDEHPLAQCFTVEDGRVVQAWDYFQRGGAEIEPAGWAHFDDHGAATKPKYEFVWPLGDVVTALARAGLRILSLEEFPTSDDHRWRYKDSLDAVRSFPGGFLLLAGREA